MRVATRSLLWVLDGFGWMFVLHCDNLLRFMGKNRHLGIEDLIGIFVSVLCRGTDVSLVVVRHVALGLSKVPGVERSWHANRSFSVPLMHTTIRYKMPPSAQVQAEAAHWSSLDSTASH